MPGSWAAAEPEPYTNTVLCACCYSVCPVEEQDPEYVGPAALAQHYRFLADVRDSADERRAYHDLIWQLPGMDRMIRDTRACEIGRLAVSCSAAVRDATADKVLLVGRVDNGRWTAPGGYREPGETIKEACSREVLEERGIQPCPATRIGVGDWRCGPRLNTSA